MNPQSLHPEPAQTLPLPLGEGLCPDLPLPLGEGRGEGALRRPAFSLVELLVVVSIILVLMAMVGGGVAAARASQKKQATQALIAKLDEVIKKQFATYPWRSVPTTVLSGTNKSAARAAYLRRLASAEMPDNWEDVKLIASGSAGVPLTAPQHSYVALYRTLNTANPTNPTPDYSDAECLFMIVMQGGIADCLECGKLKSSDKGDTDGDGAFEFLDDWGNPIRYVLWPAQLKLPYDSDVFFFDQTSPPFTIATASAISATVDTATTAATQGGTMQPLIFSGGSDGRNAIEVNKDGNLRAGIDCGNPQGCEFGKSTGVNAADNITNFDAKAK